jgi:hypothetical protein
VLPSGDLLACEESADGFLYIHNLSILSLCIIHR